MYTRHMSLLGALRHSLKTVIFCAILINVLICDNVHGTSEVKKSSPQRRERRQVRNQGPNNAELSRFLQHELRHGNIDLLQYTPTTPVPEDVNCYVDVPVTRRVGGRCVPLGSHTSGCQAGIYLAFSQECQNAGGPPTESSDSRPIPSLGRDRRRNPFRRRRLGRNTQ